MLPARTTLLARREGTNASTWSRGSQRTRRPASGRTPGRRATTARGAATTGFKTRCRSCGSQRPSACRPRSWSGRTTPRWGRRPKKGLRGNTEGRPMGSDLRAHGATRSMKDSVRRFATSTCLLVSERSGAEQDYLLLFCARCSFLFNTQPATSDAMPRKSTIKAIHPKMMLA